jgi:hypothetical protein
MKKVKKPVIDANKLGKNPFLLNLRIVVSKLTIPGQYHKEEGILVPSEMDLERDASCRVYTDSERRLLMVKLSPRAKDLLLWIMYEVEPNIDWIWINKARYMDESGITTYNTYNSAVNELIQQGYINKVAKPANTFWINPAYFFAGNRVRTFPDKVVRR